jgi:hypothetical protein
LATKGGRAYAPRPQLARLRWAQLILRAAAARNMPGLTPKTLEALIGNVARRMGLPAAQAFVSAMSASGNSIWPTLRTRAQPPVEPLRAALLEAGIKAANERVQKWEGLAYPRIAGEETRFANRALCGAARVLFDTEIRGLKSVPPCGLCAACALRRDLLPPRSPRRAAEVLESIVACLRAASSEPVKIENTGEEAARHCKGV